MTISGSNIGHNHARRGKITFQPKIKPNISAQNRDGLSFFHYFSAVTRETDSVYSELLWKILETDSIFHNISEQSSRQTLILPQNVSETDYFAAKMDQLNIIALKFTALSQLKLKIASQYYPRAHFTASF